MSSSVRRVPAIVLAAGASSRLGRPKQLELLDGERLLDRAVRVASEAGCRPVVVLGCGAERIRAECALAGADVVLNPDWPAGMASSLHAGLAAVEPGESGAVVMTCDQLAVGPEHLRRLVSRGLETGCVVASSYAGLRGVPAYFPAGSFAQLLQVRGDTGARELLRSAEAIELEGGELDVDTEASLQTARRLGPQSEV